MEAPPLHRQALSNDENEVPPLAQGNPKTLSSPWRPFDRCSGLIARRPHDRDNQQSTEERDESEEVQAHGFNKMN